MQFFEKNKLLVMLGLLFASALTMFVVIYVFGKNADNYSMPSFPNQSEPAADTKTTAPSETGSSQSAGLTSMDETETEESAVSTASTANTVFNGVYSVSGTGAITSTGGQNPIVGLSNTWVGQTSINTIGTIINGTWNGSLIADNYILALSGGSQGELLYHDGASWTKLSPGTAGQYLETGGSSGIPYWNGVSGTVPSGTVDNSILVWNSSIPGWSENTSILVSPTGVITLATWNANPIDISSYSNLAVTAPITLTGDTIGLNYNSTNFTLSGGQLTLVQSNIDHGLISGLADDDHLQYALLTGRAGGQYLYGGTSASNNLSLESTSNALKGYVLLQPNGGNVGVGTISPSQKLSVAGTLGFIETGLSPAYYTIFQGGDQSANIVYTWPTGYPVANGYLLSSTTGGVMSWVAPSGGSLWTDGGTYLYPSNRESVRVYDSGGTDYINIAHDGTGSVIDFRGAGRFGAVTVDDLATKYMILGDSDIISNADAGLLIDPYSVEPTMSAINYGLVSFYNFVGAAEAGTDVQGISLAAYNSNPLLGPSTRSIELDLLETDASGDVTGYFIAQNEVGETGDTHLRIETENHANGYNSFVEINSQKEDGLGDATLQLQALNTAGGNSILRFWDNNDILTFSQYGSVLGDGLLNNAGQIFSSTGAIGSVIGAGETSDSIIHALNALGTYSVSFNGVTLDEAYDFGGAGAGRLITADSGSVEINVTDGANNAALTILQNDVTNYSPSIDFGSTYSYLHTNYSGGGYTLVSDTADLLSSTGGLIIDHYGNHPVIGFAGMSGIYNFVDPSSIGHSQDTVGLLNFGGSPFGSAREAQFLLIDGGVNDGIEASLSLDVSGGSQGETKFNAVISNDTLDDDSRFDVRVDKFGENGDAAVNFELHNSSSGLGLSQYKIDIESSHDNNSQFLVDVDSDQIASIVLDTASSPGGLIEFRDPRQASILLTQSNSAMGDSLLNQGGQIYSNTGIIGASIGGGETSISLIHAINAVGTFAANAVSSYWSRNVGSGFLYPTNINDRIGIGTVSPLSPLTIEADSGGDSLNFTRAAGRVRIEQTPNLDEIAFYNRDLSVVFLFLESGGDIGIGDQTPAALLDVGGGTPIHIDGTRDLLVADDLEVNGTIYGTVAGTIDPEFTAGSAVFQGAAGLAEDNANYFWDDTNDRLGIGTNSPTELLHTYRDANSPTIVFLGENQNAGNTAFAEIALRSSDTELRLLSVPTTYFDPTFADSVAVLTNGATHLQIRQDTLGGDIQFMNSTNVRMTMINNGYFGIGDQTPVANLVVGDDTGAGYANGSGDVYIQNDLEVDGTIFGTVSGTIDPGFTPGSIIFAGASGEIAQDNANFFWDNTNDRLGIGTNTPDFLLDMYDNTNSVIGFQVQNGSSGTGAQVQNRLVNNANDFAYYGITSTSFNGFAPLNGGRAFWMSFSTESVFGSQSDHAVIFTQNALEVARFSAANHYLGIGTGGPDRRLDVLDASNPQLRLTYSDNAVYGDLQINSNGDLFFALTGDEIYFNDYLRWTADDAYDIGASGANRPRSVYAGTSFIAGDTLTIADGVISQSSGLPLRINLGGAAGDDLLIDTDTLTVESDNNRVGIGTATPETTLDIRASGTVTPYNNAFLSVQNTAGESAIQIISNSANYGYLLFGDGNGADGYTGQIQYDHSSNTLRFLANTTEYLTISSNGRTGINTTNPQDMLHISSSGTTYARLVGVDTGLSFRPTTGNVYFDVNTLGASTTFRVSGSTSLDSTAMYFASNGNVGIGSANASVDLDVRRSGTVTPYNDAIISAQNADGAAAIQIISNSANFGYLLFGDGDGAAGYSGEIQYNHTSDSMNFLTDTTTQLSIDSSGNITAPSVYSAAVGATNRDLYIDDTGLIGYVSSSARYKDNIQNMTDVSWLYDLRPVNFSYKSDPSGKTQYGLIAEEVNAVNPDFVSFDSDGNPETVSYSMLVTPMLKAIQDLKSKVDALEVTDGNLSVDKLYVKDNIVFNSDAVGEAKILAGDNEVRVNFEQEYEYKPVVTLTARGDNVLESDFKYTVTNESAKGFTIKINPTQIQDIMFSWHAFGSNEGKIFISDGTTEDIEAITEVPAHP